MNYAEMSTSLLKTENPDELKRLKDEDLLDDVMREVQQSGVEEEERIIQQMTKDLPEDLPYLERVREMNRARSVAQEIVASDTAEFWRSCR